MANQPNKKQRLLAELKILMEMTDADHPMDTIDIIGELAGTYDIEVERKAVQNDLKALTEMGFTISEAKRGNYYFDARPFDMEQLILLVDAAQSAPFLTEKMTDELIGGIKGLTSVHQRALLERRIEVPSRVKMANDEVLRNLDVIQQAMREKKQVSFQYTEYTDSREVKAKHGGKHYTWTPIRLVYSNEYYYLITFNPKYVDIEGGRWASPYRVDRMKNVRVSDLDAESNPLVANYRREDQESPSFGVYAAEKVPITLEFDAVPNRRWPEGRGAQSGKSMPSPMNAIVDKFGTGVQTIVSGDKVRVYAKAQLSPQFFGWLMELDPAFGVRLIFPREAVERYRRRLEDTLKMYPENPKEGK